MTKPLFLIVGKSASGKTTIAEFLEKEIGMKSLQSYTTRKPRYEGETGHTFVTDEEFDKLENIIAYTEYHEHRYCCTQEQLDDADIYVIDPPGVETLLERYDANNRQVCIMFFSASTRVRIDRMRNRGDSDEKIIGRLYNDSEYSWWDKINNLYHYHYIIGEQNLHLTYINANQDFEDVADEVLSIIEYLGG